MNPVILHLQKHPDTVLCRAGGKTPPKPGRLQASFTIEAAYVFAIVFFALSVMIRFAFTQRDACLAGFVLTETAQEAAHLEEKYDPEGPDPEKISEELRGRFSAISALRSGEVSVSRGKFHAEASGESAKMSLKVQRQINDPEGMMRAATAVGDFASQFTN